MARGGPAPIGWVRRQFFSTALVRARPRRRNAGGAELSKNESVRHAGIHGVPESNHARSRVGTQTPANSARARWSAHGVRTSTGYWPRFGGAPLIEQRALRVRPNFCLDASTAVGSATRFSLRTHSPGATRRDLLRGSNGKCLSKWEEAGQDCPPACEYNAIAHPLWSSATLLSTDRVSKRYTRETNDTFYG